MAENSANIKQSCKLFAKPLVKRPNADIKPIINN